MCFGDRLKNFLKTFLFGEHLHLCPWSLALASSIPVGLEKVCPQKGCPWPREGLSSERLALALASDFFVPWPRTLCPRLHLCLLQ